MLVKLQPNGASGFKIRRPSFTNNGYSAEVDDAIKAKLEELSEILGYRLFTGVDDPGQKQAAGAAAAFTFFLTKELPKPVLAKRTTPDHWDNAGILNDLVNNKDKQNLTYMTIGDCIDKTRDAAALKFDFQTQTTLNWNYYDLNTQTILSYTNLSDYLLAYAFFVKGITEVNGLINFVKSHREGVANLVNFAIVSAARENIQKESLDVPEYEISKGNYVTYNSDQHPLIVRIVAEKISITANAFSTSLQKAIDNYIFNGKEMRLIENANIGKIPEEIKPLLVKYIKHSAIPITPHNANFFLPLFISQILGITKQDDGGDTDVQTSDQDFSVDFLEDSEAIVQVNASNVKCAAQLFYCMVVGEELDVFNVVNYFTHKFLVTGNIEITDHKLREDLQLYVFSNKFKDASNGIITDRTRPAERQMFYRQVFNAGNAKITNDFIVNDEFPRLWKTLMYESARYLERAQDSPNPDQYVSRQNVMQSVEDLQDNLSNHCRGLVNVITPLIYNELNFVIRNILMHPEVVRQVAPVGGTWWRVVETLYAAMKASRPKATVLYNKAKLAQTILRAIAEYNPSTFESDSNFSTFISSVDAFISTQSIIQESLPGEIRKLRDSSEHNTTNGNSSPGKYESADTEKEPAAKTAKAGADEWDF